MKLEVLISCMHQKDCSIIQRSKITSDALIINQCNRNEHIHIVGEYGQKIQMISTTERGLSRSRNKALQNAKGDICLFCDDDEQLVSNYEEIILEAFKNNHQADIIVFWVDIPSKKGKFLKKSKRIKYLDTLKI